MLRDLLEDRRVLAMLLAGGVGAYGLHTHPFPAANPFLQLIAQERPLIFQAFAYAYAASWFTTPYVVASVAFSLLAILTYRQRARATRGVLPPYPPAAGRAVPSVVLGEVHHARSVGPSSDPAWLTLPQRGLYTGVLILGAIGTGKTTGCMYPYVQQLLHYRPGDAERKVGGLVLEVKGDFCHQVRGMLGAVGRADDYVEIGLGTGVAYNPLHNTLEPYALAYAIASLLNNLYGRSKEPFWQQAYTDLLKFVISLRRVADGYTTLAEIYHYVVESEKIDTDIRRLETTFGAPVDLLVVRREDYEGDVARAGWTLWTDQGSAHRAHPHDPALEQLLTDRGVPFETQRTTDAISDDRRHRLDAITRWYYSSWTQLDQKLRTSIVEGIVVFLSIFDEDPEVFRAFCPPRTAYAGSLVPGTPRPLPPLDDLIERGHVLGLNFPVSTNPALARGLGVMLKLDYQRAVLQRIPRMAAAPDRIWRDLVFVADEYHAFATVGETDPTGDERAFALSRQARLMPIVATQSLSSLRSALGGDDGWRTLTQCFRTKVFLTTSDDLTARTAADLCGRADQLRARYTISEGGQSAHVSLLTARGAASTQSLTASKTYMFETDHVFPPRVFTELGKLQAVALAYDGDNPLPPQLVYLKPHYRDPNESYFDAEEVA